MSALTSRLFRPRLLDYLQHYSVSEFRDDLAAGVVVGIVALPLAMAFAIASGVSPQAGIFTAIIAGFLIGFLVAKSSSSKLGAQLAAEQEKYELSLSQLKDNHSSVLSDRDKQIEALGNKIDALNGEIRQLTSAKVQAEKPHADKTEAQDKAERELVAKMIAADDVVAELAAEVKRLIALNEGLNRRIDSLMREKSDAITWMKKYEAQNRRLFKELDALKKGGAQ